MKKIRKTSPLMCFLCDPPKPIQDHKSLHGVVIHERVDVPDDIVYMLSEEYLKDQDLSRV